MSTEHLPPSDTTTSWNAREVLNFGSTGALESLTFGNNGGTTTGVTGGKLGMATTCEFGGSDEDEFAIVVEVADTPIVPWIQFRNVGTRVKTEKFTPQPEEEPNDVTPAIFRTPPISRNSGPPLSPLQVVAVADGAIQMKSIEYLLE